MFLWEQIDLPSTTHTFVVDRNCVSPILYPSSEGFWHISFKRYQSAGGYQVLDQRRYTCL